MFIACDTIPNIVFSFFGGIFIDRYGVRIALLSFTCIFFVGQLLVAFSSITGIFWLGIFGRIVFGIGTNCASSNY